MKSIGIVGSRKRNSNQDFELISSEFIDIFDEDDIIVSGGCPKGADAYAEQLAKKLGLTIIIHYPNWEKYGKRAGFIRNTKIAEDSNVLIACISSDRKGGTEDTIKKFLKKNELTEKKAIKKKLLHLI